MLRVYGTCIAALFGLAFGSFLNVCASRWPEGESVVSPGSHCRGCGHDLSWRENIPVASWLVLRGRCSACGESIGLRYPLVEFAVALCWAVIAWQSLAVFSASQSIPPAIAESLASGAAKTIFCWLLILLAVLDAEHLWLPDHITLGGSLLGLAFAFFRYGLGWVGSTGAWLARLHTDLLHWLIGIVVAPAIILLIRWSYRLVRRREGIGLGDAKLMLLLAVWLGLAHTLLAFLLGILLGTLFAFVLLAVPGARRGAESWAMTKIPLGTFLCAGGILSALWGDPVIQAYLRLTGL